MGQRAQRLELEGEIFQIIHDLSLGRLRSPADSFTQGEGAIACPMLGQVMCKGRKRVNELRRRMLLVRNGDGA